ncbi:hypothetical protein C8Q74DRAFT_980891 [Fomes fomentarius]|nr:hypothetical protein C8Q74DRAFT_980891 [Fomes fomentarius]
MLLAKTMAIQLYPAFQHYALSACIRVPLPMLRLYSSAMPHVRFPPSTASCVRDCLTPKMRILSLISLAAVVSSLPGLGYALRLSQEVFSLARQDRNNGIHLAVSPICGSLSGSTADVNAGVALKRIKPTIVAFRDSYTDGGRQDGGPLLLAVIVPLDVETGGRSTDGEVWVEDLAGANVMDYAQSGACTDLRLWPSAIKKVDLVGQVATFLNQSDELDPESTLHGVAGEEPSIRGTPHFVVSSLHRKNIT